MKDINYWDRFMMTGSISDFLSYRNALQETEADRKEDNSDIVEKDRSGEQSHAGLYRDYRDDFKG
ncbi:MAG: hypothetical protein J1D87_10230 [Lachnospiraceae bacterium]|nr:hypothetical protein [Lachnospiraceae bacterium]